MDYIKLCQLEIKFENCSVYPSDIFANLLIEIHLLLKLYLLLLLLLQDHSNAQKHHIMSKLPVKIIASVHFI